ncbi:MAG TPA: hypothetical protein VGO68_22555 [Pyrinomonadaceae bacterium]|jgi:hypothetical protein|nr:hypothetical protein [Pyrinomonadaceae bacterium]
MSLRRNGFLPSLLVIMFAICACEGAAYAQFTVTVTGTTTHNVPIPNGTSSPAPSDPFRVKATVSNNLNPIMKVVFYRNDVPYMTDTAFDYRIDQGPLGQENYTYHARAYDSTGAWVDSNDYKLSFYSPNVFKMGQAIPAPSPAPSPAPTPYQTFGPGRYHDHTAEVQAAVNYLGGLGGGTLLFPCTPPPDDPLIAIYNIKSTIYIPTNVTLQGESAEESGKCRVYFGDVVSPPKGGCGESPSYMRNTAMFKIVGDKSRVRFRDLVLMSRTTGPACDNRSDWADIALENTAGVEMNTDDEEGSGDITDVIFENVAIDHFTHGIKAVSNNASGNEYEISGVKIRAFKPLGNSSALYIDARYAYNWDIQNFNPATIPPGQGAVEIINAGKPSVTDGETTNIRFLQLNCNGQRVDPRPFCVKVQKHGGLYFRQLHHEGVDRALVVEDISARGTNPDPIVFESGIASGEFNDASMKLYLIGNGITAAPEIVQTGLDDARLRFKGLGRNSTVVDCGDIHWDWTDINGGAPDWPDFKMLFTHSERYRGSFFAETTGSTYIKPHTYCPMNIAESGGEFFDSGTLPNEPGLYSNELNYSNCSIGCNVANKIEWLLSLGGSVYINGTFTAYRAISVPKGAQIIGAPNAELILATPNVPLLQLDVKMLTATNQIRLSGVVIRNLKLSTTQSNTTGIAIIGEHDYAIGPPPAQGRVGASSDIHFSGLTIQGFTKGIYTAPDPGPLQGHPMIDGISLKNMTFINNGTAVFNTSANASNWNVIDLNIQSNAANAIGWRQITGGHQGLQDVKCTGSATPSAEMKDCILVQMPGGFYLNKLRQTVDVTNALTIGENGSVNFGDPLYQAPQPAVMVLRNSDFTPGSDDPARMNVLGKAFVTSMNNKYQNFNVEATYFGNETRLTYCGDSGPAYPGLDNLVPNLWVGQKTPSRVHCGIRPMAWDEAVRWTNNFEENWVGTPLVGNFFDDIKEDFVVFRPGASAKFLIQQPFGPGRVTISLPPQPPLATVTPLVGRFFPNSRAQVVAFLNGQWTVIDPNNGSNNATWNWGLANDIPFVGNFINEAGGLTTGNKDEIGIYRPSTKTFWIANMRSGWYAAYTTAPDADSEIQIADFLGLGYDQIAQYKAGTWKIINPRTGLTYTVNFSFGQANDILVAGKYLTQAPGKNLCAQVAVWRPAAQAFLVADPQFLGTDPPTNCGTRGTTSMEWGLNNGSFLDDIPLTISTADGVLRRPTAYRRTKGLYDHSLGDGQWWVHDPF